MKLYLQHIFDSKVWRVFPDADTQSLVVETRNETSRSAAFYHVVLLPVSSLKKIIPPTSEPWWVGVENFCNGIVYFHQFHNLQFANHRGIYAINARSGMLLWKDDRISFYKSTDQLIIGAIDRQGSQSLVAMDKMTGQIIQKSVSMATYESQITDFYRLSSQKVAYPATFPEAESQFLSIARYLIKHLRLQPVKVVEYLEHGDYIVISFYIFEAHKLCNKLLVINAIGEVEHIETLGDQLNGIGSQTFFIFEGFLIFIRHNHTLNIYEL